MRALTDFLNHGTLPFVGRKADVERLTSFWEMTLQGQGLRTALITGEGGIGKSRLLEETYPRIMRAGGVVLPVRLYRDAVASLTPLLRQAIASAAEIARLPRNESMEPPTSVIDSLRRISHLRPTLLVIEDIDRINHDSIQELGLLLDAISHEAISVVCVSRPMRAPIRGIVEPYLVEEITLSGLTEEDLGHLWEHLFHSPPEPTMISMVLRTTLGSPLAVRSALRGALKSEAIEYDSITGSWHLTLDLPSFAQALERNVHLLSEGMAAHLTAEEKNAAENLACLGEAFAVETAQAVVQNADIMIETLMFKGIISPVGTTIAPLPHSASGRPVFVFTHTVVHNSLVKSVELPVDRFLHIIAEGLPLYSTLPFTLLAERCEEIRQERSLVRRVIERSLEVAVALDRGPDRELGMHAWQTATALFAAHKDQWSTEEHREIQARLLYAKLRLIRGTDSRDEIQVTADALLELTADTTSRTLLEYRLMVLAWPLKMDLTEDYSGAQRAWNEATTILHRHPELAMNRAYGLFLYGIADIFHGIGDRTALRRLENVYEEITSQNDLCPTVLDLYRKAIAPYFLSLFDTPEELNKRMISMADLETSIVDQERTFALLKIDLLESTGRTSDGLAACDQAMQHLRNSYARRNYVRCAVHRICLMIPTGYDLETSAEQLSRLLAEHGTEISYRYRVHIGTHLATAGLLSGAPQWAHTMVGELLNDDRLLMPEIRLLLRTEQGRINSAITPEPGDKETEHPVSALTTALRQAGDDVEAIHEAVRKALPRTVLSLNDLLRIHAVAAVLNSSMERNANDPVCIAALRRSIEAGLEWLIERRLHSYLQPLVEIGQEYLGRDETEFWNHRIDGIDTAATKTPTEGVEIQRITMLGKVAILRVGQEEIPIRGLRQKTLLGLMVADMMLDRPLSHSEFCRIAGTGVDDPEYARKMMNGTIWRLRDLLGHDAIVTQEDTPRLNLDLVQVDLLEARNLLHEAVAALRSRSLIRVEPLLIKVFDIICGNVPFPGLYQEFFEAAREDFEFELRSTTINAAERLLNEGDPKGAEQILRRCFEMMPEDEEIAEILCRTLIQLGKRMEAKRVRMRTEEVAEGT